MYSKPCINARKKRDTVQVCCIYVFPKLQSILDIQRLQKVFVFIIAIKSKYIQFRII